MNLFWLAIRNLRCNLRRFTFLGLSMALAFMIATVIQGLIGGMLEQLNIRGARYYGGHVVVAGYQKPPGLEILANQPAMEAAFRQAGIPAGDISVRTQYLSGNGLVFFQGQSVSMRRIIGLDYSREKSKIARLEFVQGNAQSLSQSNRVLISEVVAKKLSANVGDELNIRIRQNAGRIDDAQLIVGGIFREASIFGYFTTYMDRRQLNTLMGLPADSFNVMGAYLNDYRQAKNVKLRLYEALQNVVPLFPPLDTQRDYAREQAKDYRGLRAGVLTITDYMYEIQTLMGALEIVSAVVLLLIFLVIAIGITNTYRLIIFERTREIGTLRALGMQRRQVRNLILSEAFILSCWSIVGGLILGVLCLLIISSLTVPQIPGLDIMLVQGHLNWRLNIDTIVGDSILVILVTLLGAVRPAGLAASTVVVDALRAE